MPASKELAGQHWDRQRSVVLAQAEGIALSDEHWAVIVFVFMRWHYLERGLPIKARTTARALNKQFSDEGGGRYLRRLFSEGPAAQGSCLAKLRTQALATDNSFGTSN